MSRLYQNTQTGEVASFIRWINDGNKNNIVPLLVLEGEKGRFIVEGKDLELWVRV